MGDINPVVDVDIRDAGQTSYLGYAASVIADRALPDVRDGLKPVHRRILYAMDQLSLGHKQARKKSARVVGDVIGKYHPHGDSSVYEAMVRMAQDFSMRVPLVDGQGNFGSTDGDGAAAMRYTEARMSAAGESFFDDISFNTVNYRGNYDNTIDEPVVLPLSFPNLVVNGVQGIAVGMACNIPPHNPAEIMSVVDYIIQSDLDGVSPDIDEIIKLAPAPDFPTGGLVHGVGPEYKLAWEEGRGRVFLRSRWHEEVIGRRKAIVVTEIPYQVNKTTLIEAIVGLAKPNKDKLGKDKQGIIEVEGIHSIRDETNKDGTRLVIEIKNDVEPELVFNKLLKMTQMEVSISYNATILINGRPRRVGLLEILNNFIKHRIEVIVRRTQAKDDKAAARLHILVGLLKALSLDMLDKVIATIRSAKDSADANIALQTLLEIDEVQASAILDIKLYRLTGMQVGELEKERDSLEADRAYYAEILNDVDRKQIRLVREELAAYNDKFSNMHTLKMHGKKLWTNRYTEISHDMGVVDLESLVTREMCGVLLTDRNYIRRVPIDEFNLQNRGTRGKSQFKLAEDDKIISSCQSFSHDYLLFFTETGRVFAVKAFEVPDIIKGRFISNLINNGDDKIIQIMSVPDFDNANLLFVTQNGIGKRLDLASIEGAKRKNGIAAITVKEGDRLIEVAHISDDCGVLVLTDNGKALHFPADEIRVMGRSAAGVRAIKLDDNKVVSMCTVQTGDRVMVVSESGRGSALTMDDFPVKHRGGKGVRSMRMTNKTGKLKRILQLPDGGQMVSISENGVGNRMLVDSLRTAGRGNGGVSLLSIDDADNFGDAFIWVDKEEKGDSTPDEIVQEQDRESESNVSGLL